MHSALRDQQQSKQESPTVTLSSGVGGKCPVLKKMFEWLECDITGAQPTRAEELRCQEFKVCNV